MNRPSAILTLAASVDGVSFALVGSTEPQMEVLRFSAFSV